MPMYTYKSKYPLLEETVNVHDRCFESNTFRFDDTGVVTVDYDKSNLRTKIGIQYNPLVIAQYGLAIYNQHIDGRYDNLSKILKQVDWLVMNRKDSGGFCQWYYYYDNKTWGCKSPWRSAMAQGQALSLLVRAWNLTKNNTYLQVAHMTAKSMITPIEEGGFLLIDKDGSYWLEEYMGEFVSHVLNGFIFSMWGLYDYYLLTNDTIYGNTLKKCLDTLKHNLARYEINLGFFKWSWYSLKPRHLARIGYHKIHIEQLRQLYLILGEETFGRYYQKWAGFLTNGNIFLVKRYYYLKYVLANPRLTIRKACKKILSANFVL